MLLDHEAAAPGRFHSNLTAWLGGVLEVTLGAVFERLSRVVPILKAVANSPIAGILVLNIEVSGIK
ncbi:hypothetical protein GOZ89_19745 [Agrobacterium vitis]|nr:hypothetical protein [Agrobacterium vitis]MUO86363.1 hypothetical protein [Agrobacterium vitis]MVA38211.1 hypothetical protein [Agrobacterium vitis]MVA81650.1 hypothetical protein [Agrobacterium vitis]